MMLDTFFRAKISTFGTSIYVVVGTHRERGVKCHDALLLPMSQSIVEKKV